MKLRQTSRFVEKRELIKKRQKWLTYISILVFRMWLWKCTNVQHVIGALLMHWMMMMMMMIKAMMMV